jgi:HPt (histidine-containing phosphotransfer) domain-containing protein
MLPKPAAWQIKARSSRSDTADDGRKIKAMWPAAIEGIDINVAKHFFRGDAELFAEILSGFYTSGRRKQTELGEAFASRDWATYALETHALKSAAKSIGAVVLAEEALELELAAKNEDTQTIHRKHKTLMKCLDTLLGNIEPHVTKTEDEDTKPLMRLKELRRYAEELMQLMERAEHATTAQMHKESEEAWNSLREHILQMKQYRYSREPLKDTVNALETAVQREDIELARTLCQTLQEV